MARFLRSFKNVKTPSSMTFSRVWRRLYIQLTEHSYSTRHLSASPKEELFEPKNVRTLGKNIKSSASKKTGKKVKGIQKHAQNDLNKPPENNTSLLKKDFEENKANHLGKHTWIPEIEEHDYNEILFKEIDNDHPESLDSNENVRTIFDDVLINKDDKKPVAQHHDGTDVNQNGMAFGSVAHISGYLSLGQINKAQNIFCHRLRQNKTFSISTFNHLLFAWAEKGNVLGANTIFKLLQDEGLQPDMSTYAAMLYAYSMSDKAQKLKELLNDMKKDGLKPEHIFYKCLLTENQARGVLQALQIVDPNFKASFPSNYENTNYPSLVKSLYEDMNDSNELYIEQRRSFDNVLGEHDLQDALNEQLSRELSGSTVIKSVEEIDKHNEEMIQLKGLYEAWREQAKTSLVDVINEELEGIRQKQYKPKRKLHAPFLQAFDADVLADLTLDAMMYFIKGQLEGAPVHGLCGAVGSALYAKFVVQEKEKAGVIKKIKNIYSDYYCYTMDENLNSMKMARDKWNDLDLGRPYEARSQQDMPEWPWTTKLVCGSILVDLAMEAVKIDLNMLKNKDAVLVPAFYHTYNLKEFRSVGVIRAHATVCKLFKGYIGDHGSIVLDTTSVPMLVPPRPWRNVRDGAYLLQPVQFTRTTQEDDTRQDRAIEEKTADRNLCGVFDAMNHLGACAWKTNNQILDLAIHYFNNGGNKQVDIPGPVMQLDNETIDETGLSPEEKTQLLLERKDARKKARDQFSQRMLALYKLSVANHFRDNIFWLPVNLDFRGRVYPIAPHCCHMGDDLNRGMLKFAKGVPLGKNGLRWLKIHLTNLHGAKKKAPLDEREEYANEMMDEIMDSADNPLTGRQWWMTAEGPWQALATCIEITNAIRSGDHTQYISHQPVHQDGSCNGLQHYAALGRDSYGASQVNLMPDDRPQDVYSEVAKLVEECRVKDAKDGHELAQKLEGVVSRKVIKQTVMTIVYGVTFVGGRIQIENRLKDIELNEDILNASSMYLVRKVFDSIGELFSGAKAIQDWFALSASHIAYTGNFVDWYTPLSLYVCQPYSKRVTKTIITRLQIISNRFSTSIPDSRKQKGAFPPNFVHSLDSTHMMLTALYSQRAGITFTSVHDSFWTHPANVDTMNEILREQFVALYSQPILLNLQKHFNENYSGIKFSKPMPTRGQKKNIMRKASFDNLPCPGEFDVKKVLESTYFFS